MNRPALLLSLALALAAGCDGGASVTTPIGLSVSVDSSSVQLPEELQDNPDGTPVVATVACGPGELCPSSTEFPVSCDADTICNPDPIELEVSLGDPVDLDDEVGPFLSVLDSIEVIEISYQVTSDTSTLPIDTIELYWGPPGSSLGDGTYLLGTFPTLGGDAPTSGTLSLDAGGQNALTAYVEGGARELQFFGRVNVDIEPGDPFPTSGTLAADVLVRVRASGSLL